MKRVFLGVVLCLVFHVLVAGQSMSHEEEVVRNAYAKLSFLCSIPPVTKAGMDELGGRQIDPVSLENSRIAATPVFEISDFETGAVASIANETWDKFVTVPQGEILTGGQIGQYYSDKGNQTDWNMMEVRWAPAHPVNPEGAKIILALTVAEIIKLASKQWQDSFARVTFPVTYTRFAAFTVDAVYRGKSTGPQRAIFFFGTDVHGNEFVAENDLASGENSLGYVLNDHPDLSGLLLGKIREAPAVATWLRANVMSASDCAASKPEVCCSHGRCGISSEDFNRDLAIPLPEPKTVLVPE